MIIIIDRLAVSELYFKLWGDENEIVKRYVNDSFDYGCFG